jgi:peptide/nickel transport system substrate-binding protein
MKLKRILLIYFVIALFFYLGCTSDSNPTGDQNTVDIRLVGEPERLNPLLTNRAYCKQIEWQLFMPLLQFDAVSLELYPVLAKSLPIVEDYSKAAGNAGRSYTFEIREDARWDDGRPVTAADVVFSWKLQMHPEIGSKGMRSFLSFISGVEWPRATPRRITMYTNKAFNLAEAVIGTMPIYPKHIFDPGDDLSRYDLRIFFNKDSINTAVKLDSSLVDFANTFKAKGHPGNYEFIQGCGPYRISDWKTGERIILERKSDWWAEDMNERHQSFGNDPERLVYHFIQDDATLATMLRNGAIDVAGGIDPDIFADLKADEWMQAHYQFFTPLSLSYYFIAFNSTDPTLADRKTRRAIGHLLDIDKVIEVSMNGLAKRTAGPILPVKSYYANNQTLLNFDLVQAQKLLADAGWTDRDGDGILDKVIDGARKSLSLRYKYPVNNPIAEQVGLFLQSGARQGGVEIILVPLGFGKLIEDARSRDFELYFGQWSQLPGIDDLRNIWHTANDTPNGFNRSGFGDAKTDAIIDSINIVQDIPLRDRLYRSIQKIVYEEQPYIFLFAPTERIVIHKRIEASSFAHRPGYFEQTFKLAE